MENFKKWREAKKAKTDKEVSSIKRSADWECAFLVQEAKLERNTADLSSVVEQISYKCSTCFSDSDVLHEYRHAKSCVV